MGLKRVLNDKGEEVLVPEGHLRMWPDSFRPIPEVSEATEPPKMPTPRASATKRKTKKEGSNNGRSETE